MAVDADQPVLLTGAQQDRAVEALLRAFLSDPDYAYVFPRVEERTAALRRLWRALLSYGLTYGRVYTTATFAGVACWIAPGKTWLSPWRMVRTGFALPRAMLAMKPEARARLGAAFTYTDAVHARLLPEPHWYLAALGVDPARQRQGVGGKLIQPVMALADATGKSCYLETQTADNVRFYERYGFAVLEAGEVPGQPLRIWAMIRRPGGGQG